jgi:hypothetical protein
MQLRVARLCLDCEEVHDAGECPVCGSESFAFIARWVPAPERRQRPRPVSSEAADMSETVKTYRQLLGVDHRQPARMRWVKRGAVGLAALSVLGWLWGRRGGESGEPPSAVNDTRSRS